VHVSGLSGAGAAGALVPAAGALVAAGASVSDFPFLASAGAPRAT